MEKVNVYDFDKTLLPYDSTEAFFRVCMKKYPRAAVRAAAAVPRLPLMAVGLSSKTAMKERFYRFLTGIPDVDAEAADFWRTHLADIHPWYLEKRRPDDIISSASPEFLLRPAAKYLGVRLIASRVGKYTGLYEGVNNSGAEKVRRLRREYPDVEIAEFYSDSRSDEPLANLADRAFLVRGTEILPWPGR